MNELTKPINDIGDTVLLETVFNDLLTGQPTNPTTATLLIWKDGVELERLLDVDLEVDVDQPGLRRYFYRVLPATGSGRYTYRFVGTGAVASAEEDWFYVRSSVFTNPIEE
jgi:hypothetical protein